MFTQQKEGRQIFTIQFLEVINNIIIFQLVISFLSFYLSSLGPDPFAEQLKYNQSHGITTLLTSGKEKKGMDNRQALRGFIIADKSITRKNEFPPPVRENLFLNF